ncbi:MAG: hypothetical protein IKN06_03085 [Bacteroidales bacterium]|nr:hypothetical protein [Bacteroidales bacterium]
MMQNNHTLLVLGKDLLFILVALFLIVKGRFLGAVIGVLALVWYGRDFWYRGKAFFHSAAPGRDTVERPVGQNRPENAPVEDDGKIQVTDLSGAKEVDFEKE